jgi:hypothetical protein
MLPAFSAKGVLIEDILDIDLNEAKRPCVFPSPMSWVKDFPSALLAVEALTAKDVANGVRGELQMLRTPEIEGKTVSAVVGGFSGFKDDLFDPRGGAMRRRLWTSREFTEIISGSLIVAMDPLADHLS